MTRPAFRKIVLGLAVVPLALGLAACGKKATDATSTDAPTSSTALANVAPPAGKSWSDVVEKTPEGGFRIGNPEAPIKLVEYGALSCSHCAKFATTGFEKLRGTYVNSGRVSYELRFFMLNAYDFPATLLATCGSTEAVLPLAEQFWAWQPNMFEKLQAADKAKLEAIQSMPKEQQLPAIAEVSGMTEFFASRGISHDQAASCLADTARAKALADQTETATKDFNVTGTPTFLINGNSVGSMEFEELEAKLQQAGAR
ncbi:protein-disulfide isomerase [Novosphingobium sp. PhB165]|uniref:DsbA family protein n=1 Tax=Novosphingobium sp. PhB165 TaxID=2485105 RepID=UPI00104B7129|nr:thioredoxin domain-containing protein [Novosphingobium sp. PhB165]TCM17323.1 protein-disulfide isomerase [Novosphingobium sp. PhB165]